MDKQLNVITWYSERELKFTPAHFVVSKTSLTSESRLWILNTLRGRYSIVTGQEEIDILKQPWMFISDLDGVPAFEDPKEAVLYELKWA